MREQPHNREQPPIDFTAPKSHHADTPGRYISTLLRLTAILLAATLTTQAQWDIEESHSTASLRGIHNVGGGVAWASGTHGTVRRTEDGGYLWQTCTIPPGAENLDFRGIQAFDENTAIVMSSGPGDQSRLYKTTDGCQTWKLLFTNPDKQGFFDGIKFIPGTQRELGRIGYLVGDPVSGKFAEFITYDYGEKWARIYPGVGSIGSAKKGEAMFAASNSTLQLIRRTPVIVTGGTSSRLREVALHVKNDPRISYEFVGGDIPFQHKESAGAFSFAEDLGPDSVATVDTAKFVEKPTHDGDILVAVGGDYLKPDESTGTAAFTTDGGQHWTVSTTPPHGYRSSVAYDPTQKLWITVGPNGTDISRDDGKNWQPLKPSGYDPADDDKNWNALSLPFVVGPNGRIGKLRTITSTPSAAKP
jgi:photosystem II stability/assembly factor-like uncharacterized protein